MRKFLNQLYSYLNTPIVDDDFPEQKHKFQRLFFPLYEKLPKIVCLCGSTRFMEAFQNANLQETLDGNIVLSVGCNTKTDSDLLGGLSETRGHRLKQDLDELHKRKIDLADEILVLNVGGYIGESTRSEVEYATSHGKVIRWLEPINPK